MATILITGCRSGIGYETALAFGRRGDTVYATMRDPSIDDRLRDAVARESLPVVIRGLDVTDGTAIRDVVAGIVAEGYGKIGEAGKGLEALGAILEDHRGILCAPEIQRLRRHLLLGRGESVEAEGCLRRAIELAQRRDEKSFELRAATSLARLLDGQGKRDEARALLDALA